MSTLNIILLVIFIVLFLVGCSKNKEVRFQIFSVLGVYVLIIFAIWTIQYWIKYVAL